MTANDHPTSEGCSDAPLVVSDVDMTEEATPSDVDVWRRCVCDQYGRCLADCPSADLVRPSGRAYWDRRNSEWVIR
jgi:hypothetical protein